jgi:hypothetical protein
MNIHKNARSCPASRELLVKRVSARECSVREASEAVGISDRRGREWVRRARADEPLTDRSSRPHTTHATGEATRERVVGLRRELRTVRQIAVILKLSALTVAHLPVGGTESTTTSGASADSGEVRAGASRRTAARRHQATGTLRSRRSQNHAPTVLRLEEAGLRVRLCRHRRLYAPLLRGHPADERSESASTFL